MLNHKKRYIKKWHDWDINLSPTHIYYVKLFLDQIYSSIEHQ